MESFYLLIPIALIFVALALRLLFWAINSGQYDNLDTEAHRILFDEVAQPQTPSAPDADKGESQYQDAQNLETIVIPPQSDPIKQTKTPTSVESPNE